MATVQIETAETGSRLAAELARVAAGPVAADTELVTLGLDSLALVRLVLQVVGDDPDREIDLGHVGEMRTVADLHDWLAGARADPAGADPGATR